MSHQLPEAPPPPELPPPPEKSLLLDEEDESLDELSLLLVTRLPPLLVVALVATRVCIFRYQSVSATHILMSGNPTTWIPSIR